MTQTSPLIPQKDNLQKVSPDKNGRGYATSKPVPFEEFKYPELETPDFCGSTYLYPMSRFSWEDYQ